MRGKASVFISVLLLARFGSGGPRPAPAIEDSRPSLLLIIVDTLRFDAGGVDVNRSEPAVPPSLRGRGRHFTGAIAAGPWTVPSITALLTGYYPSESRVIAIGDKPRLKGPSLAERLRRESYRTAVVVSNPTLTEKGETLYEGFETIDADAQENRPGLEFKIRSATKTTDAALARIGALRQGASPWFLLVHYFEPHGPYAAPAKFLKPAKSHGRPLPRAGTNFAPRGEIPAYQFNKRLRGRNDYIAQYQASARYALAEVERLLRTGYRSGDLKDTVVLFTSDHGEMLGEQDYWFQHGVAIDPSLVHVPLVITKSADDPLTTETRAVSNLDVLPTLCALLHAGDCSGTRGEDLYDLPATRRFPIVVEQGSLAPGPDFIARVAVAFDEGLLVGSGDGALRSFTAGVKKESQLSGPQVGLARKLVRDHLEFMQVAVRDPKTLDPEIVKKLRALGYLQGSEGDSLDPPTAPTTPVPTPHERNPG